MSGLENSRWVAVSALGAAMFAIGFSFAGVACSGQRDVSVSEAVRAENSSAVPAPAASAPAASLSSVARVVNSAPPVIPAAPAPSAVASAASKPNSAEQSASSGLKLKRLVITNKIADREPVASDDFTLGDAPVYAFVELENSAGDARNIRVMFQNEDTKATVGHVKLSIPAASTRYRTWGNTRMIRDPGHWVAVVSTADGVELGRAPFEVKG